MRGGQVIGAGDLPGQAVLPVVLVRDQRQINRLAVDGEGVATKLNVARAAARRQLARIAHGAHGLLLRGLQAGGQVVGGHGRAQAAQLGDLLAQLGQHGVGGEVAVHLRQFGHAGDAARHAVQNAPSRIGQRLGAALARIQQALAARGQRLINRFALGGDVFEKVLLLGKAGFDFFKLRQQAGERVVALLGRVGQLQRVFDGLGEQLELRTKFGPLLGRA